MSRLKISRAFCFSSFFFLLLLKTCCFHTFRDLSHSKMSKIYWKFIEPVGEISRKLFSCFFVSQNECWLVKGKATCDEFIDFESAGASCKCNLVGFFLRIIQRYLSSTVFLSPRFTFITWKQLKSKGFSLIINSFSDRIFLVISIRRTENHKVVLLCSIQSM